MATTTSPHTKEREDALDTYTDPEAALRLALIHAELVQAQAEPAWMIARVDAPRDISPLGR